MASHSCVYERQKQKGQPNMVSASTVLHLDTGQYYVLGVESLDAAVLRCPVIRSAFPLCGTLPVIEGETCLQPPKLYACQGRDWNGVSLFYTYRGWSFSHRP